MKVSWDQSALRLKQSRTALPQLLSNCIQSHEKFALSFEQQTFAIRLICDDAVICFKVVTSIKAAPTTIYLFYIASDNDQSFFLNTVGFKETVLVRTSSNEVTITYVPLADWSWDGNDSEQLILAMNANNAHVIEIVASLLCISSFDL